VLNVLSLKPLPYHVQRASLSWLDGTSTKARCASIFARRTSSIYSVRRSRSNRWRPIRLSAPTSPMEACPNACRRTASPRTRSRSLARPQL
jgi:hypothetical protein